MLYDWRIVQWVSIKLHKSEDSKHERKVQPKGQSSADQCLKTFRQNLRNTFYFIHEMIFIVWLLREVAICTNSRWKLGIQYPL